MVGIGPEGHKIAANGQTEARRITRPGTIFVVNPQQTAVIHRMVERATLVLSAMTSR
jgi:hypothetical protein